MARATRSLLRCALRSGLALLLLAGLLGDRAAAMAIDPVFFAGPGVWGLDPSVAAPRTTADTSEFSLWLTLGEEFSVAQNLQLPILNNPQASGGNATAANPYVAESEWTVSNDSDSTYLDFTLLVLRVAAWDYDVPGGTPSSFPLLGVGADEGHGDLSVVSHDGGAGTLYFVGIHFGDLAPGESATRTFRYVISGNLPLVPDGDGALLQPLPQLGVTAVAVPEPATMLLVAAACAGLAVYRRRRGR